MAVLRSSVWPGALARAAMLRSPPLLVRGSEDGVVPEDCIRKYKEALPQAQVVSIAGAGHRVEIEKKDEFVAAVKKILA